MMATSKEQQEQFIPEDKFKELYLRSVSAGLSSADIARLSALSHIRIQRKNTTGTALSSCLKWLVLLAVVVCTSWHLDWPVARDRLVRVWLTARGVAANDVSLERCVLRASHSVTDLLRPPQDCAFCGNVTEVHRLATVTSGEFERLYAYTGRPVVVEDATRNWTALHTFSFGFFRQLFSEGSEALKSVESRCQFFPYQTEFRSLRDVFLMSLDRAQLKDGSTPWYIGWSNCDAAAGNALRQHYERPYFLPSHAESSKTDWMFMGTPGYGAHMHVDNVRLPSWQAQVTGTKRWTLQPLSECYSQCAASSITVDVRPGDIIVLDTNKWFHSTLNIGNDISITIGSEYD